MFTGLVEGIGTVTRLERRGLDAKLEIACELRDYQLGESIAVNGVCLSLTRHTSRSFEVDASHETLSRTTLGRLSIGARVHLERALALGARVGGHLVSGHVDGIGRVVEATPLGDALAVVFEAPSHLAPFLAPKGSITVDGTSLTVNGASGTRFDVVLVPVTRKETLLEERAPGAEVNLEVDLLAKYVARLLGRPGVDGVLPSAEPGRGTTLDLLERAGFT